MEHPEVIEMHERVLHIREVQGPKKEGSEKARLAAVEHGIFKCQGMVERGLSDNHSMIMDFIQENKMDTRNVVEALFKLQERIEHLQAQIFGLQSQNCGQSKGDGKAENLGPLGPLFAHSRSEADCNAENLGPLGPLFADSRSTADSKAENLGRFGIPGVAKLHRLSPRVFFALSKL
ncbi:40s ribosomal protein s5-1 [Hordeum vulgare]|nr:40s ribosomal protein s5-1 [Hordeum vulgare]